MKRCLLIVLVTGCANLNDPYDNEPMFGKPELRCPSDKILYCEGRNRHNMDCGCVDGRSISNVIPVFR